MSNVLSVICATQAFGQGADDPIQRSCTRLIVDAEASSDCRNTGPHQRSRIIRLIDYC